MRNYVKFMCDYPSTVINVRKMVGYVDLKDTFQNGLNVPRVLFVYDI